MAITLTEANEQLNSWLEASKNISQGKSYTIGNRTLDRGSMEEVRRNISYWNNIASKLESGGNLGAPVKRVIPRDL